MRIVIIYALTSQANIKTTDRLKKNEMYGALTSIREIGNADNIFVDKPQEEKPDERLKMLEDNIKMDHKETSCKGADGIKLAPNRV